MNDILRASSLSIALALASALGACGGSGTDVVPAPVDTGVKVDAPTDGGDTGATDTGTADTGTTDTGTTDTGYTDTGLPDAADAADAMDATDATTD